ncbi:molybdopterin molybdotransferase MoeA [Hellea balneolensis]|uniref:molybdopterin molybdotransferase MoeA n=1 Tax=Hellea balneolensis TaxID=287478 RepID=UPI0003F84FCF|nr:molybdopterin molybdotransferase MoeA [Hellea balneolensis]
MISVINAIDLLLKHQPKRPVMSVLLADSMGAILAEDINAKITLPPLAASAMDGYAVRLSDARKAGARLKVIGRSPAGHPFQGRVNSGQAVRIFTGGAVPEGADHIVIQENAKREGDTLTTLFDNDAPRHIRKAGIDFKLGDTLITKGTRIGPMNIAIAAAANYADLPIYKRPVIALIANGDELKAPGSHVSTTDIISSNPAGLGALIRHWGGEVMDMGIASDSIEAIIALIYKAKDADIIVPVGGASVGDHDYMRDAFKQCGLTSIFEKVAVRPGKPTWFGTMGKQTVLGLPGNPASATVCAHLFLKTLMGGNKGLNYARAKLSGPINTNGPRETYMRAFAKLSKTGQLEVTPFPRQDSSLLTPLTKANVLIRLPKGAGPWAADDVIDVLPLGTGPDLF